MYLTKLELNIEGIINQDRSGRGFHLDFNRHCKLADLLWGSGFEESGLLKLLTEILIAEFGDLGALWGFYH